MSDDPTPADPVHNDEPKADAEAHAPAPVAHPETALAVENTSEPSPTSEPEVVPPSEFHEIASESADPVAEPEVAAPDELAVAEAPTEPRAESPETPTEEPPAAPPPAKRTRAKSTKSAKAAAPIAAVVEETEPAAETPEAEPANAADADVDTLTATADEAQDEQVPQEVPPENKKKWYAIKVQSGREDTIKAAILRKVAIDGLEPYFGQIMVPVEETVEKQQVRVKDKKTGEYGYQEKKVTKKRKKFHGYIFAEVEFNDAILYLFRETSGVGDFVGIRGTPPRPDPMPEHEVQSMLTGVATKDPSRKPVRHKLDFEKGDRVRIREGPFANSEGEVKLITEPKDPTDSPKVTVVVTLWGRPVDVELEYYQVDKT